MKETSVAELKCCRIQHENAPWTVNNVLSCGKQRNEFTFNWRRESTRQRHPSTGEELPANIALAAIYNTAIQPEFANTPLRELPVLLLGLKITLKAIDDALTAVREMTFEEIRRQQFSALPSRYTCIFLIPDDEESVRFWWNDLRTQGEGKRRIYEVSATGIAHRASQTLLGQLETRSVEEWEKMAVGYWSNQPQATDDEILFEGELRIIREVTPSSFSITDK